MGYSKVLSVVPVVLEGTLSGTSGTRRYSEWYQWYSKVLTVVPVVLEGTHSGTRRYSKVLTVLGTAVVCSNHTVYSIPCLAVPRRYSRGTLRYSGSVAVLTYHSGSSSEEIVACRAQTKEQQNKVYIYIYIIQRKARTKEGREGGREGREGGREGRRNHKK